jgi:hypothetical protein
MYTIKNFRFFLFDVDFQFCWRVRRDFSNGLGRVLLVAGNVNFTGQPFYTSHNEAASTSFNRRQMLYRTTLCVGVDLIV